LKKKWSGQIKHTVAQLHRLGIVWGDIKVDNVLIDDNDDAIVLDFGGGNTVGWVDQDKHGTLEGDMQGLGKLLKMLGTEAELLSPMSQGCNFIS
jgi:serine/threonine protein kinase